MVTSYSELSKLFRLSDPKLRQLKKGLGSKIHVCQNGIDVDDEQLAKYLLAFRDGEVMTAREVAKQYKVSYGNIMSWSSRGLLPYYQLTTEKGSLHLYIKSELTDDLWISRHSPRSVNTAIDIYQKIIKKLVSLDGIPHSDILQQYIHGKTMEEIAQELDVTNQRVSQLVQKATKRMFARLDYVLTTAALNQKYKEKYLALQGEYQKLLRNKPTSINENELLNVNIRDTALGEYSRTVNSLAAGEIFTIKDLISLNSFDLEKFRSLGPKSIKAILVFVEKHHLKFADQA